MLNKKIKILILQNIIWYGLIFSEQDNDQQSNDEFYYSTSLIINPTHNNCTIPCEHERFDIGKDCVNAGDRCQCVAHCCWAFDCRNWPVFAQCRKKCKIRDWSRFGPAALHHDHPIECNHFPCYEHYLIPWDIRNVNQTRHINCIKHCCFAFNCKKFSGYCRELCLQK